MNGRSAVAALRQFVAPRPAAPRCELCGQALTDPHGHLVDTASGALRCACPACALLFSNPERQGLRRLDSRTERLPAISMSEADWAALGVPVGLAFFRRNSAGRVQAICPGAAGAMELPLEQAAWDAFAHRNPAFAQLEAGVEALLVRRTPGGFDFYRVSIDRCWALTGLLRCSRHGLPGSVGSLQAVDHFFAELDRAVA
ncbi:MAG: DUF5947 family protein [Nevskia sp.]|nr:DUF5947 family protein [Nevskia sp.]